MENSETETKMQKKWSLKKKVVVTGLVLLGLSGVSNAMGGSTPAPQSEPQASQLTEQEDISPKIETKQTTEIEELPFKTLTQDDATLPAGETRMAQEGKNGSKTTTYEITLTDGVETRKKQVGEPAVVSPVDKIVKSGTYVKPVAKPSNCDSNYSGACVPIASDVDCGGGSGDGPAYVYGAVNVVGSDIYGLDRDGNGRGCE